MKLFSSVVFTLAISTQAQAFAGCYEKLTNNLSRDSNHFYLPEAALGGVDMNTLSVESAKKIIVKAMEIKRCQAADFVQTSEHESSCSGFGSNDIVVCVVESTLGYFVVSKDYLDNAHVIFNRWD